MFEAKRVTVNEATSTLIAKGPCRCLVGPVSGGVVVLGEQNVTALTGYRWGGGAEFSLGTGERVFGITEAGGGTFDVMVLTYGVP